MGAGSGRQVARGQSSRGTMSRRDLAERADRVARDLEDRFRTSCLTFTSSPERFADAVLDMDDAHVDDDAARSAHYRDVLGPASYAELARAVETLGVNPGIDFVQLRRWARTRVVYTVDPTLAAALEATDWEDTVIPGDVLAALPHPNPLVLLPTPVRNPLVGSELDLLRQVLGVEELTEVYHAFIVTGRRAARHCSTHDPQADGLVLSFLATLVDEHDRPVSRPGRDLAGVRRQLAAVEGMSVTTRFADLSMTDRRQEARRAMRPSPVEDAASVARLSDALVSLGLGLLVYLVTDDADTVVQTYRPSGRRARAAAARLGPGVPTTIVETGFRIGAALAAHQGPHAAVSGAAGSGRTVRPHIRRGHLRRVAYGRGRALRRVRWIPPVAVNWRGAPDVTQVHVS